MQRQFIFLIIEWGSSSRQQQHNTVMLCHANFNYATTNPRSSKPLYWQRSWR